MIKGICIPNELMYLDPRIRKLVYDKFDGILFAGNQEGWTFYNSNRDKFKRSMSLNGSVLDSQLRPYFDEPISTPSKDNSIVSLPANYECVIGELTKKAMKKIKDIHSRASITYTSYRKWWFTIPFTNIRIYKWWKDQRDVWDWMILNKFWPPIAWISIPLNKNIGELIDFCIGAKMEIWFYVESSMTADEIVTALEKL